MADATNPGESPEPEGVEPAEPVGEDAVEQPTGTAGDADGGFEGPDVETSLSDADLDFLSGQSDAEQLAAERLADLQRVTAEYQNYRRRTEQNREVERERAVGDTVKVLLPVLDDLDRAEKHGDLAVDTPFGAIAAKLRASAERLGAHPFGQKGDAFDPQVHEAIFQQPSADVDTDTVADVVETGYTLGSSLLRVAKVVVATPER